MSKKNKNDKSKYKQIKDYYPIVNPNEVEDVTNINVPSERDIKRAKDWVDETEK